MPHIPSVFAHSVRKIANAVDVSSRAHSLLRTIGLDQEAIDDPKLRIPYADMMMLAEHAAKMTRDPAFGLRVGGREKPQSYGIVGYSIMTSSTVEEALRDQMRYLPLWTDVGNFKLEVDGPVAHFRWEYSAMSLPESHHDYEMSLATVTQFLRLLTSANWKPREVWFRHPKPNDTSEHLRTFRAPTHFGMPANALVFDSSFLPSPIRTANPYAHRVLTAVAEQLLTCAPDAQTFSQATLSLVRQGMSRGEVSLDAVSRRLGVSRRTLQRRLRLECSSHRRLLQRARQDVSRFLLSSTNVTTVEVAYALGFSEPSAFYHTFQEWFGVSPRAYRRATQLHNLG
jgi:AraC-like DNA-binding protein